MTTTDATPLPVRSAGAYRLSTLVLATTACGLCCCHETHLTEPDPSAIMAEIKAADVQHRAWIKTCARMVGDAYRALGKANYRVTLDLDLQVDAVDHVGHVRLMDVHFPDDLPGKVADCYREHFPLDFTASRNFHGRLIYPLCVSVLPTPPG